MKPRVGVFGFSGCWGEQIVILNCEDELLELASAVEFADFLGASSVNDEEGPLDIALVEGSVAGASQEAALRRIRARARVLVACGSCACFGGVNAMETREPREVLARDVYGPAAKEYVIDAHRPLGDIVKVDVAIPGCPMEKSELLAAVACLLNGDLPVPWTVPVCAECRMLEHDCLLIARGIPCAGPVIAAGCGARCPALGVPCIGCRGPADEANRRAWTGILERGGANPDDLRRLLRTFGGPTADDRHADPAQPGRSPLAPPATGHGARR